MSYIYYNLLTINALHLMNVTKSSARLSDDIIVALCCMPITLCLDAPSRPWLDMSFGIVSPFRGWSATDAQGTNC